METSTCLWEGGGGTLQARQIFLREPINGANRGRVVYVPRYGWPTMDEAARQAWAALGFAPRQIDGLTISAMYGGALRCAVKVLAR